MSPSKAEIHSSQYRVGSVARALILVEIIAHSSDQGITLTEITKEIEGSKSTIYALLRTLIEFGYVRTIDPGPRYLPGIALMHHPIGQIANPIMQSLCKATDLTIRLAINDRGRPIFVVRIDAPGVVRFYTPLGNIEPPHVSSAGKAILAQLKPEDVMRVIRGSGLTARTKNTHTSLKSLNLDLELTRKRGYAIDDGEDVEGVICIGSAFFDHTGQCAGALSATALKINLSHKEIDRLGNLVREHARRLSRELGAPLR
jgi:IclR family acetate operon transcriptional repressor